MYILVSSVCDVDLGTLDVVIVLPCLLIITNLDWLILLSSRIGFLHFARYRLHTAVEMSDFDVGFFFNLSYVKAPKRAKRVIFLI